MLKRISDLLTSHGHQVVILHSTMENGRGDDAFSRFTCFKIPFVDSNKHDKAAITHFRKLLSKISPDLIFHHYVRNTAYIEESLNYRYAPSIRRIADPNIVCFRRNRCSFFSGKACYRKLGFGCLLHGHFLEFSNEWPLVPKPINIPSKLKEIQLNKSYHKLIVPSLYMRNLLVDHAFKEDRISVIPNIVELPSADLVASHSGSGSKRLLYLGNIHRSKGVFAFIDALSHLKYESIESYIVGQGRHLKRAVAEVRNRNLDHVMFDSWASGDKLRDYFVSAYAIVFPSLLPEAFGLVGVEALSYGRPVVAFDVGAVSEWLEDGKSGFLVQTKEGAEGLAAALEKLLVNSDLATQMGKYGRKRVGDLYDKQQWIAKFTEVLSDIL